jgi:hypothetical protein
MVREGAAETEVVLTRDIRRSAEGVRRFYVLKNVSRI